MLTRLRRKALRFLDCQLRTERERYRPSNVLLHETATVGPEAAFQNMSGIRDRISVGAGSSVRGKLLAFPHGGRILVGENCCIEHRSEIWSMSQVSIGDRVLISHDVNINDCSGHSLDAKERADHIRYIKSRGHPKSEVDLPGVRTAPIEIGDDVWISFGVTILRGVKIGARAIISARAVVTKDVPADTIYYCEIRPIMRPLKTKEPE